MALSAPDAGTAVTAMSKHLGVLRLAGGLHQHCRDGIQVLSCQMMAGTGPQLMLCGRCLLGNNPFAQVEKEILQEAGQRLGPPATNLTM